MDSRKVVHVPVRQAIDESPGRLDTSRGVWTPTPAQQPQVQLVLPLQLISPSLSPLHYQRQSAVIGKTAVVFEARHLKRAQPDLSGVQVQVAVHPLSLEPGCGNRNHACDGSRRGIYRAQINGLPERRSEERRVGKECR